MNYYFWKCNVVRRIKYNQAFHRLEPLDFKGKAAFHHFLVQWGVSMFFVEQPSHTEAVALIEKLIDV